MEDDVNFAVTSTSAPTVVEGSVNRNSADAAWTIMEMHGLSMHTTANAASAFLILLMYSTSFSLYSIL